MDVHTGTAAPLLHNMRIVRWRRNEDTVHLKAEQMCKTITSSVTDVNEPYVQVLECDLTYSGDAFVCVSLELRVHYPVPNMVALPIDVAISNFKLNAKVREGMLHVFVSCKGYFFCPHQITLGGSLFRTRILM